MDRQVHYDPVGLALWCHTCWRYELKLGWTVKPEIGTGYRNQLVTGMKKTSN